MTLLASPAPASAETVEKPSDLGAKGRRKSRKQKELRQPAETAPVSRVRRPVVDELNIGFNPGQLRRCPGCGGMVYLWPCLACDCRAVPRR